MTDTADCRLRPDPGLEDLTLGASARETKRALWKAVFPTTPPPEDEPLCEVIDCVGRVVANFRTQVAELEAEVGRLRTQALRLGGIDESA